LAFERGKSERMRQTGMQNPSGPRTGLSLATSNLTILRWLSSFLGLNQDQSTRRKKRKKSKRKNKVTKQKNLSFEP